MTVELERISVGGVWQYAARSENGGGSQPGSVYCADFLFTEPPGASADLTAAFSVPSGATVFDMWLYPLVSPWAANEETNPLFAAADALHSYFADIDLVGGLTPGYDPTDLNSGFASLTTVGADYYPAAAFQTTPPVPRGGVLYPDGDTITLTVTNIDTGGGGGQLLVRLWVKAESTPTPAT